MFSSVKKIHFVGIGGIGMSGIAEILLDQGFTVSGSDAAESEMTERLRSLGIRVEIGHSAENIRDSEVIVYSSAVNPKENPETIEASRRKLPVIRRAEMLAEVTRMKYSISIAGTHGKTSTTSMCGLSLLSCGFDPTVIVGGRLHGLGGSNARLGKGDWTVVEADEYDRSFLQLSPAVAVIMNIEPEHLDIYSDFEDIKSTFAEFARKVPFYGFVALCLDDPGVKEVYHRINKKKVTFGLSPQCMYRADNIRVDGMKSSFEVFKNGDLLGEISINIPGIHNIRNALGAITVASEIGGEFSRIAQALYDFRGVYRRFEIIGEKNNVLCIDDYAHHPTEVLATLEAARKGWKRRIVAVFQPHTYTRTKALFNDFGKSFFDADVLLVTDVYPAREKPLDGVTGEIIANSAEQFGHANVSYVQDKTQLHEVLTSIVRSNDIVISLGAGDVNKYVRSWFEIL